MSWFRRARLFAASQLVEDRNDLATEHENTDRLKDGLRRMNDNIEQHPSVFGKAWRKLGTGGGCGAGACDLGDAIVELERIVLLGLIVGIAIGRVKRGGEEREGRGYKYDVFHAVRLRVLGLIFNIHAPLRQMLSDSRGLLLPVFGGFLILASSLACTRECVPP